jgi:hypothetical protein
VLLAGLAVGLGWRDRAQRFAAVVLLAWVLVFILFHAPLRLTGVFENNLRYLIPAYPAIALLIARGLVALFDWVWSAAEDWRTGSSAWTLGMRVGAVLAVLAAIGLVVLSIRAVLGPERFVMRAYGWMSREARNDMDALAQELREGAVIGVSDQMAGAAMLYLGRNVFRPASMLEPGSEFPALLREMEVERRPVYVLGDWECAPSAGASEKLPEWVKEYAPANMNVQIRGLPYECATNFYRIFGD